MIYNYNEFLLEYNTNLKYVYHIVDFNKLNYILDNNKISSYYFQNISTTRDPHLNGYVGDSATSLFKLELDYQMLAKDYDIDEFVYTSKTGVVMTEEEEEQVKTNKIENIDKYITKIILIKDKFERMKDTGWFSSGGGFYRDRRENIPNILKEISDKTNGDLWIQDGKKVYRDNKYITDIINTPIRLEKDFYALYKIEKIREKVVSNGVETDYHRNMEHHKPLDTRNKDFKVQAILIGEEHTDMYLMLKKPSQKDYDEDVALMIFKIEMDDIISVDDGVIHTKKAKLDGKRPHGWDGW